MRGFGPAGLFSLGTILLTGTILFHHIALPLGALLVLVWRKLSKTPWQAIGYCKPARWTQTIVLGILFGVALKLFTKAVLMPLLGAGPFNLSFGYLAGNTALLPYAVWLMLVAGFAEETVYRGFLFERFRTLLGKGKRTAFIIVLITAFWFGLAHLPAQGFYGALHGVFLGLVFGTIYAVRGALFFLMVAHAAYDLLALALIYLKMERQVSEFFFN